MDKLEDNNIVVIKERNTFKENMLKQHVLGKWESWTEVYKLSSPCCRETAAEK